MSLPRNRPGVEEGKSLGSQRYRLPLSDKAAYQGLTLDHGKINSNGTAVVMRDTVGIYEILLRSASVSFFRGSRTSLKSNSAMRFQTRSESEATAILTTLLYDL